MKTVELKRLSVENYKKLESASYQFAPRTMVSGRNRQGKSTLMDAYFDTLTGKLADGTLPSGVRRKIDGEEVEGDVIRELVILIDGVETVIRKETKKGKSSSTTKYQVDGFDYNKKKFEEYLSSIADPEAILMCSNARIFLNEIRKSSVGARGLLEKMAGFDIAEFMKNHSEVSKITKGHSVEEAMKKLNKERLDWKKKLDAKKTELQSAKSKEIECVDRTEERESLLDKLSELKQNMQQLLDSSKAYDTLSYEITGLKKSMDALVEDARKERRNIVSLYNDRLFKKKQEEENLRTLENILATAEKPERIQQRITVLQEKYKQTYASSFDDSTLKEIEAEEFNPESTICPTCGQNLPEDQIEQLKSNFERIKQVRIDAELKKKEQFEKDKQQKLREINEDGQTEVARKKEVDKSRGELKSQIEKTKQSIVTLASEVVQIKQRLSGMPEEPDMSGNEEYQALLAEAQKKQEQMDGMTNNSDEKETVMQERMEVERQLAQIDADIRQQEKMKQEKADEIEQLTKEQRELSQKESDVQSQIDLLKEFSIQKNQVLADTINPHFKHFQFQFLDYTQDGEPVEVCRMIVDGIDYFNGLNHSDQILCNIDLVTGLQELNSLKLPIWIDDAESVNEERFPKMEQQVIYLKVSDNELKVEGF